ncbi:MAG: hypothetical protein MZV49_25645 [Rhodopseudomonas palustris]|nr:hypothetical protein [Rhodopseudomonas palustris]
MPRATRKGARSKDGKVSVPKCYPRRLQEVCRGGLALPARSRVDVGRPGDAGQRGHGLLWSTVHAANFAFLMYPGLTHGAAGLIEHFGTEEQKNKYMYKMYAGRVDGNHVSHRARRGERRRAP